MRKFTTSFTCLLLIILLPIITLHAFTNERILYVNKVLNFAPAPPTVSLPIYLCQNSSANPLTATPSSGGALIWYGTAASGGVGSSTAPVPSTTTVGQTKYYVSQNDGTGESTRAVIVVNVVADNGATILSFRCDASQIPLYSLDYSPPATINNSVFFDWSNNALISNSYNFSYSIDGGSIVTGNTGLSHYLVPNMIPGQSATLTLSSATHPCVPPITLICTVPCGAAMVIPTFLPIPTTYCLNETPAALPNSSNSPLITGTWNPSSIDTSTLGTTDYTFTPNPALFPCATKKILSIIVELIDPDFTDLAICTGGNVPDLSANTISPNGITGSWSPSVIDNAINGIYIFTPDPGQCATANKTIKVTVTPSNTLISVDWAVTEAFAQNQVVTIIATSVGNYLYQLDDGPFQNNQVFENVAYGTHTATVIDVKGCSAPITIGNIIVINYPKYFTPNNDSYNDTWNVFELVGDLSSKIRIFDRYGKFLKEISPNGNGWDGNYNGQPMPANDYWFVVQYKEQAINKEFKSHFSLKR